MRKPFIVRPTGLKGNEKLDRMRELMGASQLNEDVKNSVVELTKIGPDGKVYGIVREGHNYFIKVTDKKSNLVTEDFKYIGGLMNKTSEAYPTYAKAIKQLNLKFMSLNEAYGKQGNFNVFEDDNLLTEHHPYKADQKLSATKGMGDGAEYIVDKAGVELSYDSKEGKDDSQFGDNLADKDVMDEFEAVKLSENEMAIENMLVGEGDDWTEAERERIADLTHQFMSNGDDYHYAAAWAQDAVRREREKNNKTAADLGGGTSINEESVSIAQQQAAGAAQAADKVADKIESILSPEEVEFLKNAYVSGGKEMVSKAIDAELNEGIYEGAPEPPAEGEFGMSQNEIKLRQIIDKLITKGAIASLVGVIPAAMAGAPFLALGLGIAALAGSPLKDAAWWSRKGHNYSAQNKYGLKEAELTEKDDKNNPWAICTASVGREDKEKYEKCVRDVKKQKGIKESRKGFSIASALEKMDSIIEEVTTDKVTEILNSLTESEKEALLSTLKKKV